MKVAPREVTDALVRRGGKNRFGEPNYRCVWGLDRLDWMGGEWSDYQNDNYKSGILLRQKVEVRQAPKYGRERWIIERWVPPEQYGSPQLWEMNTVAWIGGQRIAQLGPYPSRGDYESCYVCEDRDGNYIHINVRLAEVVVDLVEASRRLSPNERWLGIVELQEKLKKQREAEDDVILSDNEPFHALPNSLNPRPVLELKEEHQRSQSE